MHNYNTFRKVVASAHAQMLAINHGGADRPRFAGMGSRVLRGVAASMVAVMINASLAPMVQAAVKAQRQAAAALPSLTAEDQYAQAISAMAQSAKLASMGPFFKSSIGPVLPNAAQLQAYADQMQTQWRALRERWQQAGVSQEVVVRQLAIEQTFQFRHQRLMGLLRSAQAPNAGAAQKAALADFVLAEGAKTPQTQVNLKNLPWQVQKPVQTQPATTVQALQQSLKLPGTEATNAATAKAATVKTITAPTAADLAATLDAPQTAAIQQLATSLDNNPYKIFQWVHDNIYWQPTRGSVQGAQNTLDKKAGNAVDTASLLLATLRAAGISARYVVGTIEVPADQAMNWAGGAQTLDAAQQIMSQGGIPTVALYSGGQPKALRMEHAWVEAYISYHPGRGTHHTGAAAGNPDTWAWVPMDASFKQYTFKTGMDLATAVPLDANALVSAAQQGATVNEAQGWVQNLNTAALQSQLNAYQARLKTYIDSQNGGQSTVGDVLGQRAAQIDPLPYLAGSLPYTVKVQSSTFSEVPASLRTQFRYHIYPDQYAYNLDAADGGSGSGAILSYQAPTATLAGKKLTLAWVAASAADQAAIQAMIPANLTDPSQLPRTIPASINLKPQILLDGQVVAEGIGMRAGSEPVGAGAFTKYGTGEWDQTSDQLIAGQQTALGLSIQGISQAQLDTLKTRMTATKATLEQAQAAPEAQRPSILSGITGDLLTGDLLTATIWGYFASLQSHGVIAGSQAGVLDAPALSYGLFHAQGHPNKLYGVVTTGFTMDGLNMDVGHLRSIRWVKDDNPASAINNKPELTQNGKTAAQNRWIAYNKMRGQYASAMEHATPEQFWVDKSTCSYQDENGNTQNPTLPACQQAISAVKAIAIAQAEGQKIYTINASNAATALPTLPVGGDVGAEIRSAIQAGKEVTVHEKAINAFGWSGYGYTIVDPDTGAGAYLIEGRGNGGILLALLYSIAVAIIVFLLALPVLMTAFAIVAAATTATMAVGISVIISGLALWYSSEKNLQNNPCAKMFFQTVAGSMITFPIGITAKIAKEVLRWAHLRGAVWGTGVGAAGGAGPCL